MRSGQVAWNGTDPDGKLMLQMIRSRQTDLRELDLEVCAKVGPDEGAFRRFVV